MIGRYLIQNYNFYLFMNTVKSETIVILGDIGGTNARL
jgi:hypothetical protein